MIARWLKSRQTPRPSYRNQRPISMSRQVITKGDVIVHPIADRLHARPAGRRLAKELPGDVGKLIDFAVATGHKKGRISLGRSWILCWGAFGCFSSGSPLSSIKVSRESRRLTAGREPRAAVAEEIDEIGKESGSTWIFSSGAGRPHAMDARKTLAPSASGQELELDIESNLD